MHTFTLPASWVAARVSSQLKKSGKIIDFQDIAIASIAIANNETLYSRNVKHFGRIKDLSFREW